MQCGGSGSGSTSFDETELGGGGRGTEGFYAHVGAGTGRIEIFDVEKGTSLRSRSGLSGPRGIASLGNRKFAVVDGARVAVFRPLGPIDFETPAAGSFGNLKTVCATSHPNQFICADQARNEVICFHAHADGEIVQVWRAATGPSPRGIKADGFEQVWVACKNGNEGQAQGKPGYVKVHSVADGAELLSFEVPFGPRGVAIDPSGRAWVTCFGDQLGPDHPGTGTGRSVVCLDAFGHSMEIEVGMGPFGIATDVHGFIYVTCVIENTLYKLDSQGTVLREGGWPIHFDDDPRFRSGGCTTVALDGLGRPWVDFKRSAFIAVMDPGTGELVKAVAIAGPDGTETLGDPTGYHLAMVLFPGVDHDRDGQANLDELLRGRNPFALRSTAP